MTNGIANILVVDDEPQLLIELLPLYGYNIKVEKNGSDAITNLKHNNKYDLIILDINMPGMSGNDVLKKIRFELKLEKIPVLMLTGSKEAENEVISLKTGADAFIVKPIRIPVLLAHIEAILRRTKITEKNNSSYVSKIDLSINENEELMELSSREKELLTYVAEGKNNKEVADILSIQEVTVKSHLKNIFKKLNVSNRMQAVIKALKLNLLE